MTDPATLEEFVGLPPAHRLYVFTINGFPYGKFHGTRVKEDVYLPDWRDAERLRYTDELADLLAKLLPDRVEGSVSTVPGAFKPAMTGNNGSDVERIADNLIAPCRASDRPQEAFRQRRITLAIEPEPHCYLETVDESVGFFRGTVQRAGGASPRRTCRPQRQAASVALRDYLGLCLDLCHAAVEFEDPVGLSAATRESRHPCA